MKLQIGILSTLLASALAAPAVVWKNTRRANESFLHTSDELSASDLLSDVLDVDSKDSSLAAVVFLFSKGDDGSESLTELASTGKLPATAGKYNDAAGIYHHVSGIESTPIMVREASRANTGHRVLQVSLSELNSKMTSLHEKSAEAEMEVNENGVQFSAQSKHNKKANKRVRDLAKANVLLVTVDPKEDASEIDQAVANTIDNAMVENVVLAGIRSLSEVKQERFLASKRRMEVMEKQGQRHLESRRRRLEQEEEGDGDDADQNNDNGDMSGVYYVSMTPNILAGLLFGLLFIVVTWIGVSCMGAISGQDVYVSKMPTIGREA
jgi:hypothetical protein